MSDGEKADLTYEELLDRYRRLEVERGRRLQSQQDLAASKDRVDRELARFTVLQKLLEQTLATEEEEELIELTLEAIIEAFELEVAFFLIKAPERNSFSIVGEFGSETEDRKLEIDDALLSDRQPRVIESEGDGRRLLRQLGLVSGLLCPFSDRSGALAGVLVAGVTEDGADIYTEVTNDLCSSFAVMARQTGAVWINKQLNREVIRQNARLQSLTESYSRFVPFEFLKLLARSSIEEIGAGDSVALDLNVLFADIRGFTTLSERLVAGQVFESLNEFLSQIEPLISHNHGFINQYLGDAVMALFPTSADDALRCAIEMRKAVQPFNRRREEQDLARMDFGLGIHSGPLTLGALGGGKRLDSNVIGDAANVASRIEGLTRKYGTAALTSSDTVDRLKDREAFALREIDVVTVKGRDQPITLFEVLDCDPDEVKSAKSRAGDVFRDALASYKDGEFGAAVDLFTRCHSETPQDSVSLMMAERCRRLSRNQDPDAWIGVWQWEEK